VFPSVFSHQLVCDLFLSNCCCPEILHVTHLGNEIYSKSVPPRQSFSAATIFRQKYWLFVNYLLLCFCKPVKPELLIPYSLPLTFHPSPPLPCIANLLPFYTVTWIPYCLPLSLCPLFHTLYPLPLTLYCLPVTPYLVSHTAYPSAYIFYPIPCIPHQSLDHVPFRLVSDSNEHGLMISSFLSFAGAIFPFNLSRVMFIPTLKVLVVYLVKLFVRINSERQRWCIFNLWWELLILQFCNYRLR